MANFVVVYGVYQDMIILEFDLQAGEVLKETVLPYNRFRSEQSLKLRSDWVKERGPEDSVWMMMGGGAEFFILGLAEQQGTKVMRIPAHRLKRESGPEIVKILEEQDDKFAIEKSLRLAKQILKLTTQPELFYPVELADLEIFQVKLLSRRFWNFQERIRKPTAQRVRPPADSSLAAGSNLAHLMLSVADGIARLFMNIFEKTEKQYERELEHALNALPLYRKVFEPISGVGPLTAGVIIGELGSFANTPSAAALRSYAGKGHRADGSRDRRRSGQIANWNPKLKQAAYIWAANIAQYGTYLPTVTSTGKVLPANIWRLHYEKRRAYERLKYITFLTTVGLENAEDPEKAIKAMARMCAVADHYRDQPESERARMKPEDRLLLAQMEERFDNLPLEPIFDEAGNQKPCLNDYFRQAQNLATQSGVAVELQQKIAKQAAKLAEDSLKKRVTDRAIRYLSQELLIYLYPEMIRFYSDPESYESAPPRWVNEIQAWAETQSFERKPKKDNSA